MFSRYDQDLSPVFERIQQERSERSRRRLETLMKAWRWLSGAIKVPCRASSNSPGEEP